MFQQKHELLFNFTFFVLHMQPGERDLFSMIVETSIGNES